jgi:tetratricopeptide (TPR) repeat protein
MTQRFQDNPAFVEYEKLQRDLHALIASGKGDADEADEVRDRMDPLLREINGEEQARLDGLSADLYMLSGDEVLERSQYSHLSVPDFRRELSEAQRWNDWDSVLGLLRQRPESVPIEAAAFMRFRAYQALGHLDASLLFLDYAARQRPRDDGYKTLRLMLLTQLGRHPDALREADENIASKDAAPDLLVASADAILQSLNGADSKTPAHASYTRVLAVLMRALTGTARIHRTFAIFGWLLDAECKLQLGDSTGAIESMEMALRLAPGDGDIVAAIRAARASEPASQVRQYVSHALQHVRTAAEDAELQLRVAA